MLAVRVTAKADAAVVMVVASIIMVEGACIISPHAASPAFDQST